jgi:hypothetical protein
MKASLLSFCSPINATRNTSIYFFDTCSEVLCPRNVEALMLSLLVHDQRAWSVSYLYLPFVPIDLIACRDEPDWCHVTSALHDYSIRNHIHPHPHACLAIVDNFVICALHLLESSLKDVPVLFEAVLVMTILRQNFPEACFSFLYWLLPSFPVNINLNLPSPWIVNPKIFATF